MWQKTMLYNENNGKYRKYPTVFSAPTADWLAISPQGFVGNLSWLLKYLPAYIAKALAHI